MPEVFLLVAVQDFSRGRYVVCGVFEAVRLGRGFFVALDDGAGDDGDGEFAGERLVAGEVVGPGGACGGEGGIVGEPIGEVLGHGC